MAANTHPNYAKYRGWTLFSVWVFFALHLIHWRLNETTLAPLELNEVLYTIHQGIVTAGFILMIVIMIATLIFGRFFCSWGCHILSLQDACSWILKKLHIRSRPIRSRTLVWVPMGAMLYLFIWPQILMLFHGVETASLHVVENTDGRWSSFMTDDLWRNLPPVEIALSTFFVVGFLLVYLLGSRSFCFYGCPYGALFSMADQVAPGRIKLTGNCIQCGTCTVNCTSDILVHREIKEYGMVTSSKCMKDMDCVASCPENALSFGFATPPLFRKGFKLPDYNNRYDLTVAEDVLVAVVFLFSVFVFRGLYGLIPFLMAVGMSVATAFAALLVLRMFTQASASINSMRLKISGRLKMPGYIFAEVAIILFSLTFHSAIIQYHSYAGQRWYERINTDAQGAPQTDQKAAEMALAHLEKAYSMGIVKPVYLQTQLASIYLLQNRVADARQQLQSILKKEPLNVKALYRLAVLERKEGTTVAAMRYFETVTESEMTDEKERYMVGAAHMALAGQAQQKGNMQKAIPHLEKSLELNPNSAMAHNNLGAIYARLGNVQKAIVHFGELARMQPTNPQAFYNLGMMQMKLSKNNKARINLNNALRIDPGYALATKGLARLNARMEAKEK